MMDSELNKLRIDTAFKTLDVINKWIANIDTKASFILAFLVSFMGVIVSNDPTKIAKDLGSMQGILSMPVFHSLKFLIPITMYCSVIYGIYAAFNTLIARIENPNLSESLIFFGSIAAMPLEEYKQKMLNNHELEFQKDVLEQIHTNSLICLKKSKWYNKSVKAALISVMLCTLCLVFGYL